MKMEPPNSVYRMQMDIFGMQTLQLMATCRDLDTDFPANGDEYEIDEDFPAKSGATAKV